MQYLLGFLLNSTTLPIIFYAYPQQKSLLQSVGQCPDSMVKMGRVEGYKVLPQVWCRHNNKKGHFPLSYTEVVRLEPNPVNVKLQQWPTSCQHPSTTRLGGSGYFGKDTLKNSGFLGCYTVLLGQVFLTCFYSQQLSRSLKHHGPHTQLHGVTSSAMLLCEL